MMITQRKKEKKKAGFRISFIFLFIFASFAVCFVLYMKEDFEITEEMLENTADAVVYIDPVGQGNAVVNPVPKGDTRESSYYDDAVFIGGRTLAGLGDYGFVPSGNMIVSEAITLSNIDTVILSADGGEVGAAEAVLSKNPKKVYVMIGINDLSDRGNTGVFDGLESFIRSMGGMEIYLMSLIPVPAERENTVAFNSDIDEYNSLLLKFADKMNVHYLDVNTDFRGNDGKLPASYAETNGVRLKKEVYGRLSEYILSHTAEDRS